MLSKKNHDLWGSDEEEEVPLPNGHIHQGINTKEGTGSDYDLENESSDYWKQLFLRERSRRKDLELLLRTTAGSAVTNIDDCSRQNHHQLHHDHFQTDEERAQWKQMAAQEKIEREQRRRKMRAARHATGRARPAASLSAEANRKGLKHSTGTSVSPPNADYQPNDTHVTLLGSESSTADSAASERQEDKLPPTQSSIRENKSSNSLWDFDDDEDEEPVDKQPQGHNIRTAEIKDSDASEKVNQIGRTGVDEGSIYDRAATQDSRVSRQPAATSWWDGESDEDVDRDGVEGGEVTSFSGGGSGGGGGEAHVVADISGPKASSDRSSTLPSEQQDQQAKKEINGKRKEEEGEDDDEEDDDDDKQQDKEELDEEARKWKLLAEQERQRRAKQIRSRSRATAGVAGATAAGGRRRGPKLNPVSLAAAQQKAALSGSAATAGGSLSASGTRTTVAAGSGGGGRPSNTAALNQVAHSSPEKGTKFKQEDSDSDWDSDGSNRSSSDGFNDEGGGAGLGVGNLGTDTGTGTPSSVAQSSPASTSAASATCAAPLLSGPRDVESEVDQHLRRWARGKGIVQLLNTINEARSDITTANGVLGSDSDYILSPDVQAALGLPLLWPLGGGSDSIKTSTVRKIYL